MVSTLGSNLLDGMPLDLSEIEEDTFRFSQNRRIEENNANFANLSRAWSEALRQAFEEMINFPS